MGKRIKVARFSRLLTLGSIWFLLIAGFQNCSSPNDFNGSAPSMAQSGSGNGDGYGGKITLYQFSDPNNPCSEKSQDGKPLANSAILVGKAAASDSILASVRSVREECRDITPRTMNTADFVVESPTQIRNGTKTFASFEPADFRYVASLCPAGRAPIADAARDNYFDSAFDLSVDPWGTIGGMSVHINGSIGGLPTSRLSRSVDANSDHDIRTDQYLGLKRNTDYVLSFVAGNASSPNVSLIMYANGYGGEFQWNLASGVLETNTLGAGISGVSATSRRFGNGWLFTLYFTTSNAVTGLDIGFAPSTYGIGEYVDLTAPQLEEVDSFCSP